jgi:hypothetical protein
MNRSRISRTGRKNERNRILRRKKGCMRKKESENTFENLLILLIRKKWKK